MNQKPTVMEPPPPYTGPPQPGFITGQPAATIYPSQPGF